MKRGNLRVAVLAAGVLVCLCSPFSHSLQRLGFIGGVVRDQQGNPVGGARILVEPLNNPARKLSTTANRLGKWRLIGLTSGQWRITVTDPLHISSSQRLFVRQLGRNRPVKFHLKKFLSVRRVEEVIDPVMCRFMHQYKLPGMAVGIVHRRKLIYVRGFGVRAVTEREPITPDTLFNMASVSKLFVAAAVMRLAEAGKLDLDAPLVKYLPYFTLKGEGIDKITIRQILSHQSGLPLGSVRLQNRQPSGSGTLEQYVRDLRTEILAAAPGKEWRYSNMGFNVLGEVISKVSGLPFEDYVKKNILDPLGMYRSTFRRNTIVPEMLSLPHVQPANKEITPIRSGDCSHAPSCSLYSNIREMAKWAGAVLHKERFRKSHIMKPSSFASLLIPQRQTGLGGTEAFIGLGWFLGQYRGHRIMGHSGHVLGYKTHFMVLPDDAAAIIILINADYAPLAKISTHLLNILLGLPPTP